MSPAAKEESAVGRLSIFQLTTPVLPVYLNAPSFIPLPSSCSPHPRRRQGHIIRSISTIHRQHTRRKRPSKWPQIPTCSSQTSTRTLRESPYDRIISFLPSFERCISVGTRKGYSITNVDPFGKVYTMGTSQSLLLRRNRVC